MLEFDETVSERLSLVEAVDHLLNRGVVLVGSTTLSLAGVDLVYVGLNLLVSSVESLRLTERHQPPPPASHAVGEGREVGAGAALHPSAPGLYPASQTRSADLPPPDTTPAVYPLTGLPARVAGDSDERPERGLARLVLTLIELLRQILERQALRRTEGEGLTEAEVERMGVALMELETKMAELRAAFGLSEEDLNLDLGPLGRLL